MCRFSGPVERVSSTNIFARLVAPGRQALVYSMDMSAARDVAMVLSLPTPPGSPEDAVEFTSFEDHPHFFAHLGLGFATRLKRGGGRQGHAGAATLEVKRVGAFEASFVPRLADFERLDPRFRLPPAAFDEAEADRGDGYVVFKLKAGPDQRLHPMAFVFPTRLDGALFFPTVHVHDGSRPRTARFDHTLYAQAEPALMPRPYPPTGIFGRAARLFAGSVQSPRPFEPSGGTFRQFASHVPVPPLLDPDRLVLRSVWRGRFPNVDVVAAIHG